MAQLQSFQRRIPSLRSSSYQRVVGRKGKRHLRKLDELDVDLILDTTVEKTLGRKIGCH